MVRYVTISSTPWQLTVEQENALRASQIISHRKPFAAGHAYKWYSTWRSEYTFGIKTFNRIHSSLCQQAILAVRYVFYSLWYYLLKSIANYKKHLGPDQRLGEKRKRSQGTEDLVPQPKKQRIDLVQETFTRENGVHHQLSSSSISPEQLSEKKRRRAVSAKSRSEVTNNNLIFERPEQEPKAPESEAKEKAPEIEEKEKDNPISYWAVNHTWPDNFAESCTMSSNIINKRPRTSDPTQISKNEKSRSYSQSRKNEDVPEQYTKSYEKYIFTQGLDMNYIKDREFVSSDSKIACQELRKMKCAIISPTIYFENKILQMIDLCQNTNEAMASRDITTLVLSSIKALYLTDEARYKDLTDQVRVQWHESWVLTEPRPEPDLIVDFLHSAFTVSENEKLTNYTSFENLTRSISEMCFPFLMCEVKCDDKKLDYADRQNMHSCSVAVKALLKIEQKTDQYRNDKQFESLLDKILVYLISHDQKDARVWGHYALIEEEKWTYYRHHIAKFDIAHEKKTLLAFHNLARNVLTDYASQLLERLQKAIAALSMSSTLSFSIDTMNLMDDSQQGSQQLSQDQDAEGFVTPGLPASAQKWQKEQMNKLLQQLEQQGKDSKEREEIMERQLQEQRAYEYAETANCWQMIITRFNRKLDSITTLLSC